MIMGIKSSKKITGLFIISLIIFLPIYGQQSSLMYYMQGVPQSYLLNPATQPRCGFFLGLPGLSPLQVKAENSAFSLSDVLFWSGDSTITPLHPDADFNDIRDNFKKVNYISTEASTTLITYGFRSNDTYHTFDITQRVIGRLSYPGSLIDLYDGIQNGDEFDFSGFGTDALAFLEIGSGMSKKINDVITVGYRFKFLFGEANITSRKTDLKLTINDFDATAKSKFEMKASVPFVEYPPDTFKFDDINFRDLEDMTVQEIINSVTGSWGLGLDLGIHVRPIDKLTLSASVLDLGYIRWSGNAYNVNQDEIFVFEGLDFEITSDIDSLVEILSDSIENTFVLTGTEKAYTTFLPAKIYIGAKYDLIEQISVSFLSRTEFYKGRLRQQFNLSANFYPIKMVAATLNYSIENNTYDNFGAGLALKAGPFNFYVISDKIPLVYAREESENIIIPNRTRTANIRIGFNLVFGCRGQKKFMKDLPLIF